MRIAFVGGQGSGKSTCAAVFGRFLAAKGLPVLAVDTAPDRRLGGLLGHLAPPRWSAEHLSGQVAAPRDGMPPIVVLGPDGLGPVDGPPTCPSLPAADGMASSRFDLTVLVSEPTRRAVGVYRRHAEHAAAQGAVLRVLGNKASDWGDAGWLTEQMGDALVGCVGHSAWVRAAERGTAGSVSGLEPGNTAALAAVRAALDGRRSLNMEQGGPMSGHPAVVERAYSASRR